VTVLARNGEERCIITLNSILRAQRRSVYYEESFRRVFVSFEREKAVY